MLSKQAFGTLSDLTEQSLGVFAAADAVKEGVSRKQLSTFCGEGIIVRELPGVYRMTVVARSTEQRLRAALLWAGDSAAAAGRSAGELYRCEGVHAKVPEIAVPASSHMRSTRVIVHRSTDFAPLMVREHRGLRVTGVEATLVGLAHRLVGEAFEVACEAARRRRLTSTAALRAYIDRFGRRGLPGVRTTHELLDQLDPKHPARSTLEVKTRRLLVASGMTDFRRELPLEWEGRTYWYDFVFERARTILEANGRRWHDDPVDYEHDNEKWSVPARHGYRLVFATWEKVTLSPRKLIAELAATFAA